jgi:hypothetical protein
MPMTRRSTPLHELAGRAMPNHHAKFVRPPKRLRGDKRRYVCSGSKFMATPLMQ